jgi:predicted HicB family RNase H-like nuclease
MKDRDRYLKVVEWSEEDQCYVGSVPGWIDKCCHGNDEEEVYHKLCQIIDEWIETYRKDRRPIPPATAGRKYSGKFQLRVGNELHHALAIRALESGESLNNYCAKVLKKAIQE